MTTIEWMNARDLILEAGRQGEFLPPEGDTG